MTWSARLRGLLGAALLTTATAGACARGTAVASRTDGGSVASATARLGKKDIGTRGADVLTWNAAQRLAGFPHMDTIFRSRVVRRGARVTPLQHGRPLVGPSLGAATAVVDSFVRNQHVAGLLVLHDGKIRLERYALGHSPAGKWTSFSVAKSLTSTLLGAAIRDGFITSLEDSVTRYIPALRGSAYDGVTLRHLLTMTSGVLWNEDYADPNSDIARLYREPGEPGVNATVSYMRRARREAPPGAKWVYKTPETNLVGLVVMAATRKRLADYLSEKIWRPLGMEHDATWLIDGVGDEQGGCCLQASLRDFGRFGLFVLDGAKVSGTPIVPDEWLAQATRTQADIGRPGSGYGFQWWTLDDGTFQARGIFGQTIHIDPARRLVIVISSAWPVATGGVHSTARRAFIDDVTRAVDAESANR